MLAVGDQTLRILDQCLRTLGRKLILHDPHLLVQLLAHRLVVVQQLLNLGVVLVDLLHVHIGDPCLHLVLFANLGILSSLCLFLHAFFIDLNTALPHLDFAEFL